MFVIARTSAYTYKNKAIDPRQIGEELSVRYLLEGSMRKLNDSVRVNAQLIDTKTGAHLWADRFDQKLNDLNTGQEEIVRRIGVSLNVAMLDIESARSKRERPTNPDAFDLIFRARSIGMHPMGPRENADRLDLFEQALRLDPNSILAMAGLATALIDTGRKGDELDRAARLAAMAATINPNHQSVLGTIAYVLWGQGRYAEATIAYRRLLDYYPNFHVAYGMIGLCLINTGRAEEAIPIIQMAIQRDPRNPYIGVRYGDLGTALLLLGKDEESIAWTQRALAANPNVSPFRRAQYNLHLAAADARLGRFDEAHAAVAEANRVWPYDTVRSHWPDDPTSLVYVAQIERFQAALRLAGHRDHAEQEADFGVATDNELHQAIDGLTPMTAPGAKIVLTADLPRLIDDRKPIIVDTLAYFWGRSIPGAVGLKDVGWGSSVSDVMQQRLRLKMRELTLGDLNRPLVAVGWNSERFDGRNLALRLVALGYSQVYWYRGGREAWEVNGLPEGKLAATTW